MKLENYIKDMERLTYYLEQNQNCGKLTHENTVDKAIELFEETGKGLDDLMVTAKRMIEND